MTEARPEAVASEKRMRERMEKERDAWNEQTGKNPDDLESEELEDI